VLKATMPFRLPFLVIGDVERDVPVLRLIAPVA
jgi:hypothetical protein